MSAESGFSFQVCATLPLGRNTTAPPRSRSPFQLLARLPPPSPSSPLLKHTCAHLKLNILMVTLAILPAFAWFCVLVCGKRKVIDAYSKLDLLV